MFSKGLFGFENPALPTMPSFISLPSLSVNFLPSLPSLQNPGEKGKEVCSLDTSHPILVYNIAKDKLSLYNQTELDMMRTTCVPLPSSALSNTLSTWPLAGNIEVLTSFSGAQETSLPNPHPGIHEKGRYLAPRALRG